MPRVFMLFLLQIGLERGDEAARVVTGDVVGPRLGFPRPATAGWRTFIFSTVPAAYMSERAPRKRQDRAAHLAKDLPHVDAELGTLAALERAPDTDRENKWIAASPAQPESVLLQVWPRSARGRPSRSSASPASMLCEHASGWLSD
jgi:hypothetical protein